MSDTMEPATGGEPDSAGSGDVKTARAIFMPSGKRGDFPVGTPLLTCARELGVDIDSVCGGRAICGRCQVQIGNGEFSKHGITSASDHVSDESPAEARYREKRDLSTTRRLSCQSKLMDDVVVDVPPESQIHKQVVRKRAEARQIAVDPIVRLYYVEVEKPDMHNPLSDLARTHIALETQWQLNDLKSDLDVIKGLQRALRDGDWSITVAVYDQSEIISVWPGYHDTATGLAIDVGSTTIAVHLCDLITGEVLASAGAMNPQIRYGEDLMSRVSYVMLNEGSQPELTRAVRDGIDVAASEAIYEAERLPTDVLSVTLAGNPVMHHLLLGIDPTELGVAPFALATGKGMTVAAREIELNSVAPGARCYILPCIAGHVGADAAAVTLSEAPQNSPDVTLLVDVGTNAELVLGNETKLLAASSPTGPAFEGAQIAAGQRAAPGAIERVRIDPETLEPKFKIIGCGLWSDEDGFDKATESIGVTGLCGSGIIEVLAEMFLAGLITQDGIINGEMATKTNRIIASERTFSYMLHSGKPDILITQDDVRAIQLAKAALHAGARLLMTEFGVEKVDRIVLAGAFGAHIDVKHALVLGMLPDCELERVTAAGNAAGTGARIALLNKAARVEVEELVSKIHKIETAVEPRFQDYFIDALAFPHKSLPYERLRAQVSMPAFVPSASAGSDEKPTRRRRRNR